MERISATKGLIYWNQTKEGPGGRGGGGEEKRSILHIIFSNCDL